MSLTKLVRENFPIEIIVELKNARAVVPGNDACSKNAHHLTTILHTLYYTIIAF